MAQSKSKEGQIKKKKAVVVVAQWTPRSLPILEDPSSNPAMATFI